MSKRRLREIRRRLEGATPGLWRGFDAYSSVVGETRVRRVGTLSPYGTIFEAGGKDIAGRDEDWEFILHARQDMAYLLAQVEKRK